MLRPSHTLFGRHLMRSGALLLFLVPVFCFSSASGQTIALAECIITAPAPSADCSSLEIRLDKVVTAADIDRVKIIDHESIGRTLEYTGVINPVTSPYYRTSIITLSNPMFAGGIPVNGDRKQTMVFVFFKNKNEISIETSSLKKREPPPVKHDYEKAKAEGKTDSDVYLSGESVSAVDAKPQFTFDVKLEREFGFLVPWAKFKPSLSVNTSTEKKADNNKLNAGFSFINSFGFAKKASDTELLRMYGRPGETQEQFYKRVRNKATLSAAEVAETGQEAENKAAIIQNRQPVTVARPLTIRDLTNLRTKRPERSYFRIENGLKLEFDRDWKVANFINNNQLRYLFKPIRLSPEAVKLYFTPFIGGDFGTNIKSPIARTSRAIARASIGATVLIHIDTPRWLKNSSSEFLRKNILKEVDWETNFIYRALLAKEQAYDLDEKKNLILRDFVPKPHPFFTTKITYKVTNFLNPTLKYEWGEEPPLYQKIHHKLTFGFTYMFKDKNPE